MGAGLTKTSMPVAGLWPCFSSRQGHPRARTAGRRGVPAAVRPTPSYTPLGEGLEKVILVDPTPQNLTSPKVDGAP